MAAVLPPFIWIAVGPLDPLQGMLDEIASNDITYRVVRSSLADYCYPLASTYLETVEQKGSDFLLLYAEPQRAVAYLVGVAKAESLPSPAVHEVYIHFLCILPDYRRHGAACKLLRYVLQHYMGQFGVLLSSPASTASQPSRTSRTMTVSLHSVLELPEEGKGESEQEEYNVFESNPALSFWLSLGFRPIRLVAEKEMLLLRSFTPQQVERVCETRLDLRNASVQAQLSQQIEQVMLSD